MPWDLVYVLREPVVVPMKRRKTHGVWMALSLDLQSYWYGANDTYAVTHTAISVWGYRLCFEGLLTAPSYRGP
jgi:hypothetical protein